MAYTLLDKSAVVCGISAARLWGIGLPLSLDLGLDQRLHLSRPPELGPSRRAHVIGHVLTLRGNEFTTEFGVRLTTPQRTWLDLAAVLPLDDLIVAGDSIICEHNWEFPRPRLALASMQELSEILHAHAGARGAKAARAALTQIRVGADSPPETRMRLSLIRNGLPEPTLNVVVRDARGRAVLWPDAAYPEFRVALQYDGVHHGNVDQHRRDIRRADITASVGWREVRVSLDDLRGDGRQLIAKTKQALEAQGWHTR